MTLVRKDICLKTSITSKDTGLPPKGTSYNTTALNKLEVIHDYKAVHSDPESEVDM
jgi:hypothetical protein